MLALLLSMLNGPSGTKYQPLLVELCLTLPAPLSGLLPFLRKVRGGALRVGA